MDFEIGFIPLEWDDNGNVRSYGKIKLIEVSGELPHSSGSVEDWPEDVSVPTIRRILDPENPELLK